ncbi:glycerol ethanol, ferric requiring protein [Irineochytrium annulatum]|nr:glycerol ethanol, ferric requiring protein [Irineochytrium annulatum]
MVTVAFFFWAFSFYWDPQCKFEGSGRDEEEFYWIEVMCAIGATRHLIFPLAIYAIVCGVSSVTQFSIHSVISLQETFQDTVFAATNLSAIYDTTSFGYMSIMWFLFSDISDAILSMAVLQGTLSRLEGYGLFVIDGMLCSGTYFDDTDQTVQCLVDTTTCADQPLNVMPDCSVSDPHMRVGAQGPKGLYKYKRDPAANNEIGGYILLKQPYTSYDLSTIVNDGNSTYEIPINNVSVYFELTSFSSLNLPSQHHFECVNAENFSNMSIVEENASIAIQQLFKVTGPVTVTTTGYQSYSGYNTDPLDINEVDHWSSVCHLSASLCDVNISGTSVVGAPQNCIEYPFTCLYDTGNDATAGCLASIGIGTFLRQNDFFRQVLIQMSNAYPSASFSKILRLTVGRLALSWGIGLFDPVEIKSMPETYMVNKTLTVRTVSPTPAIAMDLILFLLLVAMFLAATTAGLLSESHSCAGRTLMGKVLSRRLKWDPLWRIAPKSIMDEACLDLDQRSRPTAKVYPVGDADDGENGEGDAEYASDALEGFWKAKARALEKEVAALQTKLLQANNSTDTMLEEQNGTVVDNRRKKRGAIHPINGANDPFEEFQTISWIDDLLRDQSRLINLRKVTGRRWDTFLNTLFEASQSWIVVLLVGITIGLLASCIAIVAAWLTDVRLGYCRTEWYLSKTICCTGYDKECLHWVDWSGRIFGYAGVNIVNWIFYVFFSTMFATAAAVMVVQIAPHAAGSGTAEVKTILGGFIVKGFLGLKTCVIKGAALPLTVASGLAVGKEGPMIHVACCVGNIIPRLFSKYWKNEARKREILSGL